MSFTTFILVSYKTLVLQNTILDTSNSKRKKIQKILWNFYERKYKLVVRKRSVCLKNVHVR